MIISWIIILAVIFNPVALEFTPSPIVNKILGSAAAYAADTTTRYEETSTATGKTGTWNTCSDTVHSNSGENYSSNAGDTFTLTFTGTAVSWIAGKSSTRGIAKVYIDDVYQQDVDLYSASSYFNQIDYTKTGLTSGTHTIKIEVTGNKNAASTGVKVSVDAFDVVSPVGAQADSTPPITTVTTNPTSADGANEWYKTLPSITLARDETGTTYYQWDATSTAGWQTYSMGISALEGEHSLYYYSVDVVGNTEDIKSKSIKTDTLLPIAFDLILPANDFQTDNPQPIFTWSASSDSGSGLANYRLFVDDTVSASDISADLTSIKIPSRLTPGSHGWYVQAVDVAGNVRQSTSTRTVTAIDTVYPVASELMPTGIVNNYLPVISAYLSDIWSGIDASSVTMKLDGVPTFASYNDTFGTISYTPSTMLSRGKHYVELSFKDIVGNQSTTNWDFIVYGTPVSGIISQDTTWTVENSPYIIESTVTLEATATLSVEPGVVVKLWKSNLYANGTLLAQGTEQNPIYATSLCDDSIGGDTNGDGTASAPAPADWGSVYLRNNGCSLSNNIIKYADSGVSVDSASPLISMSTITECFNSGIYINGFSNPQITDNTITANGPYNEHQYLYSASLGHYAFAIEMDINANPLIENNTVNGNDVNGIRIVGESTANKVLQPLNDLPFVILGDNVKVGYGKTLTIKPGTIVKFERYAPDDPELDNYFNIYNCNLVILGYLSIEGEFDKVYFTSLRDDSVGGDTNGDGDQTQPYNPGRTWGYWQNWSGIGFAPNSSATINGLSFLWSDWGLYVEDCPISIQNSRFAENNYSGVGIAGNYPDVKITSSSFEHNYMGVGDESASRVPYTDTPTRILSSLFKNNWYGVWIDRSTPAIVTGNDFVKSKWADVMGDRNWNPACKTIHAKNNSWSARTWHIGDIVGPNDSLATSAYHVVTESLADGTRRVILTDLDPMPAACFPFRAGYGGRNAEYKYGLRTYSGYFGDPVNSSTGNFAATYEDIALPSKGNEIKFSRSYNSQDAIRKGPLGFGWTHPYEQGLRFSIEETATTDTTITAFLDEGRRQIYTKNIFSSTYESQPGVLEKLIKNDDGTYVILRPDQSKLNFDSNGILTSLVDSYENTTTLAYTNHLLTSISALGGRSITLIYSNDRIVKVEDNAGRFVEYGYNSNGDLITFKDLNGKTTTYTYDSEHQLMTVKLPKPSAQPFLTNHYADGKVDYQLDAFLSKLTFSYDTAGKRTALTDNKGAGLTHFYDEYYREVKEVNEISGSKSFEYNDLGLVASITDENTHTTRFFYDINGNTTETIDASGHSSKASYDLSNNNILWREDSSGVRTNYSYDETGKFLTSIANPITKIDFEYYSDGLLHYLVNADATTTCEYNSAGDLIKVIDPLGKITSYEYDAAGRKTASIDANNHETNIVYDGRGNVTSIKDPLSVIFPSERHQVDFTYDDNGNRATFMDANSNKTLYMYSDMNFLTGIVDALENTTTYTYDANYNLETIIDARGSTTTYDYWANNRLKSVKDTLNNTRQFFYDGVGNLTKVIYPNGNEKHSEYTDDNLLRRVTYSNEPISYIFDYNPTHTLKSVADNAGRTFSYEYNPIGWLTGSTDTLNPQIPGGFAISKGYDQAGRITGIKPSTEETTTYEYNLRGDLTRIDLPAVAGTTFGYDDERQRTSIATPEGSIRFYAYDEAGRVTTVENTTSSSSQQFVYTHDANGNILSENDSHYTYDALNRLRTWYNPTTETTTTYYYDSVGNLTSAVEGTETVKAFTYNSANQISSTGFSYDANGNLTADGMNTYTYNSENRLKEVKRASDNYAIAIYEYDYLGRRIAATEESETTFFHYDGDDYHVIAESDTTGTVTARYYYDDKDQLVAMKRDGQNYYYQFNAHGDVISLTNSSGQVVNTYAYDPWGNILTANEQVANPYRYAGYRYDKVTGLYYLWHRYYGSEIGRFLTRDPYPVDLSKTQGLNAYSYCENNPVNRTDPTGLWYSDTNVTATYYVGLTGGVMACGKGGIHPYAGIAMSTVPSFGVSNTWSNSNPTPGLNIGLQYTSNIYGSGQVGLALSDLPHSLKYESFYEVGRGATTSPGLTLTMYWVW